MKYPRHLLQLIENLKKLPGVGKRSAERYAFEMLSWDPHQLQKMGEVIRITPEKIKHCEQCGCLTDEDACHFCHPIRNKEILCVIASSRDAFTIDETGEYKGLYHVLGTLLSPMDGIGPEALNLEKFTRRITENDVKEVILALDSTLEGDTTALFLKQELEQLELTVSRLAFGLPMGSSLDYVDGSTLAHAFTSRASF